MPHRFPGVDGGSPRLSPSPGFAARSSERADERQRRHSARRRRQRLAETENPQVRAWKLVLSVCCDAWQHWTWWQEKQYSIASASLHDQFLLLSSHPSVLAFMLSSDELPPPDVEGMCSTRILLEVVVLFFTSCWKGTTMSPRTCVGWTMHRQCPRPRR